MNKNEIHNQVLSTVKNVIKHGQLNEKVLLSLKMTTSLYNHIEVTTHYFDEDNPTLTRWIDVEGMGYGWVWTRFEEHKWHEMMSKIVSQESKALLKEMNNTYYLIHENERGKVYHFISTYSNGYRVDTIITFSNDELFY